MAGPVRDGPAMIAQMSPRLDERRWCFVYVTPDRAPELLGSALGTFREDEGVSAIVPAHLAAEDAPVFSISVSVSTVTGSTALICAP